MIVFISFFIFFIVHSNYFSNWWKSYEITRIISWEIWIDASTVESLVEKSWQISAQYKEFIQWFFSYKANEYDDALWSWEWIIDKGRGWCDTTFCLNALYNWANALYERWLLLSDTEAIVSDRTQAIWYYDMVISSRDDEKAKHNKQIVQKALDELQKDQDQEEWKGEESNQGEGEEWAWWDQQNQEGEDGEWSQQWSENEEWSQDGGEWESAQEWSSDDQSDWAESWTNEWEDAWKDWWAQQLSENQKQQLQQYQQLLQQEQFQNQQFFNPLPTAQPDQWQSLADMLFWRSQLQKTLPNTQWQKDW